MTEPSEMTDAAIPAPPDPAVLPWRDAEAMIRLFLPDCEWQEEVLEIEPGHPGELFVDAESGARTFAYRTCRVKLWTRKQKTVERRYSFYFRWIDGEWVLMDLPGVVM